MIDSARHGIRILLVVLAAAACNGDSTLEADLVTLPVAEDYHGTCLGYEVEGLRLAGSASDTRVVWAVDLRGARRELVWPVGYRARLREPIEVIDGRGATV